MKGNWNSSSNAASELGSLQGSRCLSTKKWLKVRPVLCSAYSKGAADPVFPVDDHQFCNMITKTISQGWVKKCLMGATHRCVNCSYLRHMSVSDIRLMLKHLLIVPFCRAIFCCFPVGEFPPPPACLGEPTTTVVDENKHSFFLIFFFSNFPVIQFQTVLRCDRLLVLTWCLDSGLAHHESQLATCQINIDNGMGDKQKLTNKQKKNKKH